MSNKKILIISIFSMFSVVMTIVAMIFFSINKSANAMTENIAMIKSNYANFSSNLSDTKEIKTNLLSKLSSFENGTYEEVHDNYVETLKEYDKNVKYIDSLVKDMEKRCKYKYEDITIQLLCKGYDALYEETINAYITNINNYNKKLTKYNETIEIPYKLHKPVYDKYIDYDKDGECEGK